LNTPAKEFDYATNPYTKLFITRDDGQMVTLLYERMTNTFAWGRITTGEGKIISCAVLPGKEGFDEVYMVVKRKFIEEENEVYKYYLERLQEDGGVYLDSWSEWKWETEAERDALLEKYGSGAVIYSEKENKVLNSNDGPSSSEENKKYIGYPYKSVFKSMPVIKDGSMKPVSMTVMYARLLDSFMPDIWNTGKGDHKKPITGVTKRVNQFTGQSPTLQVDIVHDDPNRCCVLSVYTEV